MPTSASVAPRSRAGMTSPPAPLALLRPEALHLLRDPERTSRARTRPSTARRCRARGSGRRSEASSGTRTQSTPAPMSCSQREARRPGRRATRGKLPRVETRPSPTTEAARLASCRRDGELEPRRGAGSAARSPRPRRGGRRADGAGGRLTAPSLARAPAAGVLGREVDRAADRGPRPGTTRRSGAGRPPAYSEGGCPARRARLPVVYTAWQS